MDKQELIDKAVEINSGKLPDSNGEFIECHDFILHKAKDGSFYPSSVCSVDEYKKRARELGWCNGYKYGVEYPTNGKKPDLPDDVLVEFKNTGNNQGECEVRDVYWHSAKSFRIVDERYRPKPKPKEQMIEVTDTTKGLHGEITVTSENDIWHLHGELPELGTVVSAMFEVEVFEDIEIIAYDKYSAFVRCLIDDRHHIFDVRTWLIRPLNFEERLKFIQKACAVVSDLNKHPELAFGQMFDAGFRAPE